MNYAVSHMTTYAYSQPVSGCHNLVHLRPRATPHQQPGGWGIRVTPAPETVSSFQDYFGNEVTIFSIHETHQSLKIVAGGRIRVSSRPADPEVSAPWERARELVRAHATPETLDAFQYVWDSPFIRPRAAFAAYAAASFPPGRSVLAGALGLTRRIFKEFRYQPKSTTIATPLDEVFEKRAGVCQDFAHLMIALMRSLGLPARYVSGYLRTVRDPKAKEGPGLVGADASHAWVSVFCPEAGWVDFDPTNDRIVSDEHITLAWGRDYDDVSPLKGVILGGDKHTLEVAVDVRPIDEKD